MGTKGSFHGGKPAPGSEADLSPPSSAESRMHGAIIHNPSTPPWRGAQLKKKAKGQIYLLPLRGNNEKSLIFPSFVVRSFYLPHIIL
jgi:hypothetical protein